MADRAGVRGVDESLSSRITHDVSLAAAKLSPPAAAMMFGFTLNEWVAIATLIYLALQSFHLAWKWQREWTRSRREGGA